MPDDIGLDQYIRNLEKRLEKLEARELSRVSSWNVGTGTAAGRGELVVDGNIESGGDGFVADDLAVGGDIFVTGSAVIGGAGSVAGDMNVGLGLHVGSLATDPDPDNISADSDINAGGDLNAIGDIRTIAWNDYAGSSTVTGWASFTEKKIEYKKVGKFMFVNYRFGGTSGGVDGTVATFTLPFAEGQTGNPLFFCRSGDAGGAAVASFGQMNGVTATLWKTIAVQAWTASGFKTALGQFFYQVA